MNCRFWLSRRSQRRGPIIAKRSIYFLPGGGGGGRGGDPVGGGGDPVGGGGDPVGGGEDNRGGALVVDNGGGGALTARRRVCAIFCAKYAYMINKLAAQLCNS